MVQYNKNVWCKHSWRNFWFNQHKRHKRFIVMDRDKTQLIGCNSITNWLLHFKKYFQLAFEPKKSSLFSPFCKLETSSSKGNVWQWNNLFGHIMWCDICHEDLFSQLYKGKLFGGGVTLIIIINQKYKWK